MAAKPYHKGHDALIRRAAGESDVLEVYVSLSDRGKKTHGEAVIKGSAMEKIWREYVIPSLPPNVDVALSHTSPVTLVFASLEEYERDHVGIESITIWGGDDDVNNWRDEVLQKYMPLLTGGNILHKRVVPRSEVEISGKQMREHLFAGRTSHFKDNLPDTLCTVGDVIIGILLEGNAVITN